MIARRMACLALALPLIVGCVTKIDDELIVPLTRSEDAKGVSDGQGWVDGTGKANPDKWRADSRACTDAYNKDADDPFPKGLFNDFFLRCMRKAGWHPR